MLLDSTGMHKLVGASDLREFLFRIIVLFPDIDIRSNFKNKLLLFEYTDKEGNVTEYRVHHLIEAFELESFRNKITEDVFLYKRDEFRSIANSVQFFSGFSLLDENGNMVMFNSDSHAVSPSDIIESYNTAADIINFGKALMGEGFFPE